MKLLYNAGAVAALGFGALGIFQWILPPADPARYLLSFLTGLSIALLVNAFHLYDRITALEKTVTTAPTPPTLSTLER